VTLRWDDIDLATGRLGGLDEALDLPVGEIFTAALANCYIY
jgi:hypothetical protein